MKNKAILLDRDGIIIKLHYDRISGIIDTPTTVDQVEFVPGIFELMHQARHKGYLLILISNQPGIGIKKLSAKNHNRIKNHITKVLQKNGLKMDGEYYCMHHPHAQISKYKKECTCRKPKNGLITKATKDFNIDLTKSWMIGDGVHDIIAGHNSGYRTILVGNIFEAEYLRILEEKLGKVKPTLLVKRISEIEKILN